MENGSVHLKKVISRDSSRKLVSSSHPKTKPEVKKSSARILGGSSNVNHGGSRQSRSQLSLNERLNRVNVPILPKVLGGRSSTKGLAVRTSSQEGMIIGDDSRKRKRAELEVNSAVTSKKAIGKLWFCGICMEWKPSTEIFKSACSHSYCLHCLGCHVGAKIRDNVVKVKCPDLACRVYLEPQNCRSFVPKQVIDRWESVLCESLLGPNKFYCPFRDCSGLMVVDDRDRALTSAECPYCHRLFCARCRVPWHSGSQCKAKVDYLDRKFAELAKKEKWQKCPNCKFHVQKTQGCECIKCRCDYNFCYVCGGEWRFGHLCSRRR